MKGGVFRGNYFHFGMQCETVELVAEFVGAGTIPHPVLCVKVSSNECRRVVGYQGLKIHGVLTIIVGVIVERDDINRREVTDGCWGLMAQEPDLAKLRQTNGKIETRLKY
ncbi:hypothetical protein AVEN_233550-1 [Araneus ventricosus]|uniref:Uncharacterized protein n=1 Tax=Araneus ventricosus TaxID=182803 RepID=A0A4Y2NBH3_ARAVE|nr:hypothetical protein AVEN_233550-1 [Araneus ventricosus]